MANINLVTKHVAAIGQLLSEDLPTTEEYLLITANLLYSFGLSNKEYIPSDLVTSDANKVELALMVDPDNPYLAAILQSHILVKWSKSFSSLEE